MGVTGISWIHFLCDSGEMCKHQGIAPEMLMVPATIACSLSFCSPVSTPPNAIAFATGL